MYATRVRPSLPSDMKTFAPALNFLGRALFTQCNSNGLLYVNSVSRLRLGLLPSLLGDSPSATQTTTLCGGIWYPSTSACLQLQWGRLTYSIACTRRVCKYATVLVELIRTLQYSLSSTRREAAHDGLGMTNASEYGSRCPHMYDL